MKKWVTNLALLGISLGVSMILAELALRLVLHPVDFVQPTLIDDAVLNHRIAPGTGGHDALGYRNYRVPDQANIIAVGDSMTYGVAATFESSWPNQLAGITKRTVYNMSLGGYGPLHYLHLLATQGLELDPEMIIVGLYLGNDFMDAYNLTYSNDHWAKYRTNTVQDQVHSRDLVDVESQRDKFLGGLRDWLSKRSVLYSIVTRSVIGELVRRQEVQDVPGGVVEISPHGGSTYVNLASLSAGLDLEDERIREGMRLSRRALEEIARIAGENGLHLIVAVIPTKASVYREQMLDGTGADRAASARLLSHEAAARGGMLSFLTEQKIKHVDLLPALREAATMEAIYPVNDGHPNAAGYEVIAWTLSEALGQVL